MDRLLQMDGWHALAAKRRRHVLTASNHAYAAEATKACHPTRVHASQLRAGHSLMELIAAMVASAMLLAGLGSVMLIARLVAYTPMGASRRADAANVISQLTDDLQHATVLIGQSPTVLEFVVMDR